MYVRERRGRREPFFFSGKDEKERERRRDLSEEICFRRFCTLRMLLSPRMFLMMRGFGFARSCIGSVNLFCLNDFVQPEWEKKEKNSWLIRETSFSGGKSKSIVAFACASCSFETCHHHHRLSLSISSSVLLKVTLIPG